MKCGGDSNLLLYDDYQNDMVAGSSGLDTMLHQLNPATMAKDLELPLLLDRHMRVLASNPLISVADLNLRRVSGRRRPTARKREREQRQREGLKGVDKLQRSIGKRCWTYRNGFSMQRYAAFKRCDELSH
jgi:hypothetical protein